MDVEHLWFSSKPLDGMSKVSAKNLLPDPSKVERERADDAVSDTKVKDVVQTLTVMADKRLYKLVKWCKSLPLFKNILVCIHYKNMHTSSIYIIFHDPYFIDSNFILFYNICQVKLGRETKMDLILSCLIL